MKKAVGYISSTNRNNIEREIELKVQQEHIREFCVENKIFLAEIYQELKESTEDYKAELFRLLNDAQKGEFQYVIVASLDRIAFDTVAKVWVTDELKKKGIKLHSLTESTVLSADTSADILKKAELIKKKVRDIPSLPEVINKIISLIQNPNSSASQLAQIISNDAGLTARVLRLVNSSYYGFPKQISSIQHAIAILGFTTIRGLVLSSGIFKVFAPLDNSVKLLDYKKLWKHSFLCAIIAKHINKLLKISDGENLFSASILHDMGKIILDQYDHGNYILALTECSSGDNINENLKNEKHYCGLDHCETGHLISEHWNLPDAIGQAIRYHHAPQDTFQEYRPLVTTIAIANIFSIIYEKDLDMKHDYFDNIDTMCLRLDYDNLYELYTYVKEELDEEDLNLESYFE